MEEGVFRRVPADGRADRRGRFIFVCRKQSISSAERTGEKHAGSYGTEVVHSVRQFPSATFTPLTLTLTLILTPLNLLLTLTTT